MDADAIESVHPRPRPSRPPPRRRFHRVTDSSPSAFDPSLTISTDTDLGVLQQPMAFTASSPLLDAKSCVTWPFMRLALLLAVASLGAAAMLLGVPALSRTAD